MCAIPATVNPNALPLLLAAIALTISVFFEGKLTSEALPIMRQERSVDDGPLHGSDFLSVFIDSSPSPRSFRKFTKATPPSFQTSTEHRVPRSTRQITSYTEIGKRIRPTVGNLFKINRNGKTSSENKMSDGLVVAVRVSSSVGKTLINKNGQQANLEQGKNDIEESSTTKEYTSWTSTEKSQPIGSMLENNEYYVTPLETETSESLSGLTDSDKIPLGDIVDQISIASEEHPSVIAESNKNEFNIEEKEPITTNSDLGNSQSSYLPSNVAPRLPDFNPPSDLLKAGQSQTKVHPYQQTVIFHNTGGDNHARSVSYSTVAQGVSNIGEKNWDGEKFKTHERQERHYDGSKTADFINNFGGQEKDSYNNTDYNQQVPQSYPVTESSGNIWDVSSTTSKFSEKNWESPEKTYVPRPSSRTSYAHPEQNYEVDESVSVVTNGRVHGVQPKQNDSKNKKDDNQKVGYVVEGRNYRKYRVEERTSDGFIVGEYGVVSHDDGSLRGVRYTADGTINPRLIYDALMKFLSL